MPLITKGNNMNTQEQAQIAAMAAEILALKAAAAAKYKVALSPDGEKVMIMGLRKFPITLWKSEWKVVLDTKILAQIKALIG